ncbi:MAG TPA: DNA polymerase III subunit delta', partial [Orrella sp.]
WYHQATHRGGWRVVVLYPAEALSVVSANALLKALEEPPANTLFLLASDAPDRLLPTLVSRCQKFALKLPDIDQCVQWLKQNGVDKPQAWLAAAGGAPLAALQLAQSGQAACPGWASELITDLAQGKAVDLPGLADNLAKGHASGWLGTLQRLTVDLGFVASGLPARYFPGLEFSYTDVVRASEDRKNQLTRLTNLSGTMNQQARLANHPLSAKLFAQQCLQTFCDALK